MSLKINANFECLSNMIVFHSIIDNFIGFK